MKRRNKENRVKESAEKCGRKSKMLYIRNLNEENYVDIIDHYCHGGGFDGLF